MGRVLLSDLPAPELRAFLQTARIVRHTEKSIVDPAALETEIEHVARQGYAIIDEELEIGLRSLAVPIRDRSSRIVAAINISTQSSRFTPEDMRRQMLPHLRQAARAIEDYFVVQ